MGIFKEIKGDLIKLAYQNEFDVIAQGCNCFCTQGAGIAVQFVRHFGTDKFDLEDKKYKGDKNKLGKIDYERLSFTDYNQKFELVPDDDNPILFHLYVVNCYTQFYYGKNHADGASKPLDYDALTSCMSAINNAFKGKKIGLPLIGAGLAGGDWNKIKDIIQNELIDCDVTIVHYDK